MPWRAAFQCGEQKALWNNEKKARRDAGLFQKGTNGRVGCGAAGPFCFPGMTVGRRVGLGDFAGADVTGDGEGEVLGAFALQSGYAQQC